MATWRLWLVLAAMTALAATAFACGGGDDDDDDDNDVGADDDDSDDDDDDMYSDDDDDTDDDDDAEVTVRLERRVLRRVQGDGARSATILTTWWNWTGWTAC